MLKRVQLHKRVSQTHTLDFSLVDVLVQSKKYQ